MKYLDGRGWTSPSVIGIAYGDHLHGNNSFHNYHSAWASPRCKSLVKKGLVVRNDKGHYRKAASDDMEEAKTKSAYLVPEFPTPMTPEQEFAFAAKIASTEHLHQTDKSGKPYILHDVIEDSNGRVTIEILRELGFSERVLGALKLLTHEDGVPYDVYIDGICTNYDAIRVKRKDLEHNSDITRLKGVRPKDLARIEKYHRSFIKLGKAKKEFQ